MKATRKARELARNLTSLSLRALDADELSKVNGGREVASTSTSGGISDDTMVDEVSGFGKIGDVTLKRG